ncbi:MAG: hypothetical protein QHJ34_13635 [bacterium]|jgi:hypothetical protein|nr:hypothetical protein [candidate division KSB1 bacterium]MDH7561253.1 hypothetical protein [bacterium]
MKQLLWLCAVIVVGWGAVGLVLVPSACTAQSAATTDLRTMERILDRLVLGEAPSGRTQTRGVRLEGHGVLFSVPYTLLTYAVEPDTATRWSKMYPDLPALYYQVTQRFRPATAHAAVDSVKSALLVFFSRWAGAITGLQPEHLVTVVVDFQPVGVTFPKGARDMTRRLVAAARFADILNLRKGTAPLVALQRAVRFTEEKGGEAAESELAIMADILDTHLRTSLGGIPFGESTRALRVPHLGVVLVCGSRLPPGSGPNTLLPLGESYEQAMKSYREAMDGYLLALLRADTVAQDTSAGPPAEPAKPKSGTKKAEAGRKEKESREQQLRSLANEVVDLLGRYCPALRSVPEGESVVVLLEVGTYGAPQATRLQIAVKMRDVRRLAREEISPAQFRSLAAILLE